ncbi:MAG: copper resistance CopC/CopD family protein [Marmoricola sp.]
MTLPHLRGRTGGPAGLLASVVAAVLASVVALAIAVVAAPPAAAHATLEESSPGSGEVVPGIPAQVVLRFSEAVSLLPASLQVYAPDGSRADHGEVTHPHGASTLVSVGLHGSREGTYLVSWRVVSADSHPISGAFTFSVGHASRAPTAPAVRPDTTVSVLLGAFRWLGYAGIALLLGGVALLLRCWPPGWGVRVVRRALAGAAGAVALGAVGGLLLQGPYDAGRGVGAVGRGALLTGVLGTTYGVALVVRLALAGLALVLLTYGTHLPRTGRLGLGGAVALALLGSFAAAGHAVSSHPVALAVVVDMVHVAAMSLWLGGLALLAGVVLRRDTPGGTASIAAERFSPVALGSVVALVLTGSYQSWRQLGAWAAFADTTYGRELLVKLVLVASVLVVAAVSRALVRRNAADSVAGTVAALRRTVALESVGAVLVLAVTSALVATEPGRTAYHPSVATTVAVGPDTVEVSAVPVGDRRMSLHLAVLDAAGRPSEPPEVSASLSRGSLGPLPVRLARHGSGQRMAVLAVPVAGDWQLTIRVRTSAIDEDSGVVRLPIR